MNRWKLLIAILLVPLIGVAQTKHVIVPNKTIEVKDGGKRYGTITYQIRLIGGKQTGANEFDFTGEEVARLQLDIKGDLRNKFKGKIATGVLLKDLMASGSKSWRILRRELLNINMDGEFTPHYFQISEPGEINFPVLPVSWVNKEKTENWLNESSWTTLPEEKGIFGKNLVITGLKTAADREWDGLKISSNAPLILDFILSSRGQNRLEEAKPIIESLVADDMRTMVIRTHDDIQPKQQFIDKYQKFAGKGFAIIDDRLASVRKNIEEIAGIKSPPPPPPPPPPVNKPGPNDLAKKAWEGAVYQRDTQLLIAYLDNYAGVIPENDESASDSLLCWRPPAFKLLKRKNNREQIQLKNFLAPAYYDIYEGRLDIDDLLLVNHKLLSIDVQRSGKFNLTIVDKGCPRKKIEIPLDNLMSAEVTGDTLSGNYVFTFEGGRQPYSLQLVPQSGEGREYVRQNIREGSLELSRDSLQAAGLTGKYLANAYSTDSDSPVAVAGPTIDVPERPWPSWILPALIVLAIGLLALLLLFILRNGKPQQRTIFEEA